MSLQRLLALSSCIIALVGIIGSRKLPMVTGGNIAEGFTPLLYSVILLIGGIFMFFSDKRSGEHKDRFNIRTWFLDGAHRKALVFFLINVLMLILLYLFGPFIAVLVYCILGCFGLKRQGPRGAVVFSIVYTIAIYIGFIVLLKMQFDRGIIFEMLR